MKKNLLSFLFFAFWIYARSQDAQIQKLQQEIRNHPKQDTFLVNRLNDLTNLVTPKKSDSIASIALAMAKRINYTKGILRAFNILSYAKAGLGDNEQAMNLAQQAYTMAVNAGDKEYQVRGLITIGIQKLTKGDTTAFYDYLQAEGIAENLSDARLLNICQRVIGDVYNASVANYPKAMEWILKSIRTGEEIKCASCLENSWTYMGDLYGNLGDYEKSLFYYKRAQHLADSLGAPNSNLQNSIGETYRLSGKYSEAIVAYQKAQSIDKSVDGTATYQSNIADVYVRMNNLPKAFSYAFASLVRAKKANDEGLTSWIDYILARAYLKTNRSDSALYYATNGLTAAKQSNYLEFMRDNNDALANIYAQKKDFKKAYNYYQQYIIYRDSMVNGQSSNKVAVLQYDYNMAKTQAQITALNAQKKDQRNLLIAALSVLGLIILIVALLLRNIHQKQKVNKVLQQQKREIDEKAGELAKQKANLDLLEEIGHNITSSLSVEKIISTAYKNANDLMDANIFGIGIYNDAQKRIDFPATYEEGKPLPFYSNALYDKNRFASVCFNNNKEIIMGDLSREYKNYVQTIQTPHEGEQPLSLIYLPLIAKGEKLGVLTVQSFQKNAYTDYHLYMLRNIAVYAAIALENASSYEELKSTQAQLIQSEKMASLGELTAGIAHEIQNPLNFVNNFSEVNNELIEEVKDQKSKNEEVDELLNDIFQNNEKISYHGKRADAIVKNMLQHSRASSGQKEFTEINALCDEYLRLSYHGMRAKDKSFNADFKTDFDEMIGKINIVPQDIGRVLLNLINNAFYAVNEKVKQHICGYKPIVTVTTKKKNGKVEIGVLDNGNGIADSIKEKIFQPFFTTKPSGQGTGLGLSLSYDIIKVHGGEIKVQAEGEGSGFYIYLSVS